MGRISAFLLGGAVGALAALAFAPYTGEKMRALVAEKANAFAEEAKDFGAGLPGSAQDAYKAAREKGESFINDAQGKANETDPDELREKIEAARQRIAAQVMENAEKAKGAAADVVEGAAEKVEDAADAVADKAEDAADAVADKAEDAKHAAK